MNEEEKSMVEYKESKGLFQWIKSKFEKLKERFRPKTEIKPVKEEGPGLTAEQLDVAQGGYPNPSVLDFDELEAKINNLEEPKSWELTEEEQKTVQEGYDEIKAKNNQSNKEELESDELSVEDLDKVNSYQDGIAPRFDYPKKKEEQKNYFGR